MIAAEEPAPGLVEGQKLDLRVGLRLVSGDKLPADAAEFAIDPELREPLRPEA